MHRLRNLIGEPIEPESRRQRSSASMTPSYCRRRSSRIRWLRVQGGTSRPSQAPQSLMVMDGKGDGHQDSNGDGYRIVNGNDDDSHSGDDN